MCRAPGKGEQRLSFTLLLFGTFNDATASSLASEPTTSAPYAVSTYEKFTFYYGIAGNSDHPNLLYRSDYKANPFRLPQGRFATPPAKRVTDVYGTSITKAWRKIARGITSILKANGVSSGTVDAARFVVSGEDGVERIGPPVIWISVIPGSFDNARAHIATQPMLALLRQCGAGDAVASGPGFMSDVATHNPTAHVRHPFTSTLNIPLTTKERQEDDFEGSLTLYFHEDVDQVASAVLGVSCSHVLRINTLEDYRLGGPGAPRKYFQRSLDHVKTLVGHCVVRIGNHKRDITRLEAINSRDAEEEKELKEAQRSMGKDTESISELEKFYNELKTRWSDASDRDIGFLRIAKALTVGAIGDRGDVEDVESVEAAGYTEDWGAFELLDGKYRKEFKGTVVDLGTKVPIEDVAQKFSTQENTPTPFIYPSRRLYEIDSAASPELLDNPDTVDNDSKPCLIVGKDGTTTGLTFGRYSGLESVVFDSNVESWELAIYNWSKGSPSFCSAGDSGALIWDGKHRAVGQLHSHGVKSCSNNAAHVTYATPAWWLIQRIKKEFPNAGFFHKTWHI
ncbi:uncharacterized protein BXZ73DRAFT_88584 [Epithele typhae]|uniref:uncharacterized protein n=1 Tax=Epithele typhae TaxID=378194 RepID=UPI0020079A59|nr:uncharacterized protein BXZ73DRAFT_88584 [Epithele typhae]KAH9940906.1 hypothetical protein BXZ73DRAFT_88584 [Epithele typhae]